MKINQIGVLAGLTLTMSTIINSQTWLNSAQAATVFSTEFQGFVDTTPSERIATNAVLSVSLSSTVDTGFILNPNDLSSFQANYSEDPFISPKTWNINDLYGPFLFISNPFRLVANAQNKEGLLSISFTSFRNITIEADGVTAIFPSGVVAPTSVPEPNDLGFVLAGGVVIGAGWLQKKRVTLPAK